MSFKRFFSIVLCILFTKDAFSTIQLIEPEDIFSPHELENILRQKNFFHYKDINDETPIWVGTYRKYSHHLLGPRTHIYSMEDVLHKVITDGFPVQMAMEQIYRGRWGIHAELGNILPQLNLNFGDVAQIGVSNIFTNIFSFMLPSNWLRLSNQIIFYDVTKLLLVKTILDEMLTAKELYLHVHQLIIEYEILNYYYVHLQVFLKRYPQNSREIFTSLGFLGTLGNQIVNKRLEVKVAFEHLARVMALEKLEGAYTVGTFNISEIKNFPKHIHELDIHADLIKDKEGFLKDVVRQSLELKIANEFFKMSKLDVGISASGGVLSVNRDATTAFRDSRFAFSLGYGNIPRILISKSLSRTAKLDVQRGFIELLTTARIILDQYTFAFEKYVEAKQALVLNREALKKNLEYLTSDDSRIPDSTFILSLSQLLSSEMNINQILHRLFRSKAAIDRYLLREHTQALQYLPSRDTMVQKLEELKQDRIDEIRKEEVVDVVFSQVKKEKDLRLVLYRHREHPVLSKLSDTELVHVVKRNIGNLLYSKGFFKKRRKFYKLLLQYVQEKKIELTTLESYVLKKKTASLKDRIFRRDEMFEGDILHNLNFDEI